MFYCHSHSFQFLNIFSMYLYIFRIFHFLKKTYLFLFIYFVFFNYHNNIVYCNYFGHNDRNMKLSNCPTAIKILLKNFELVWIIHINIQELILDWLYSTNDYWLLNYGLNSYLYPSESSLPHLLPDVPCLVHYSMCPAWMSPGLLGCVGQGMQAAVIPC